MLSNTPKCEANPRPDVNYNFQGMKTFGVPYSASIDEDNLREFIRVVLLNSFKKTNKMAYFAKGKVKWDIFLCHLDDIISLMGQS